RGARGRRVRGRTTGASRSSRSSSIGSNSIGAPARERLKSGLNELVRLLARLPAFANCVDASEGGAELPQWRPADLAQGLDELVRLLAELPAFTSAAGLVHRDVKPSNI